jgi:hypothetical protein
VFTSCGDNCSSPKYCLRSRCFSRIAETVRLHGSYSQFTEIINYARISHQFLYSNTAFNGNVWRLKLQATELKKKSLFIIHIS